MGESRSITSVSFASRSKSKVSLFNFPLAVPPAVLDPPMKVAALPARRPSDGLGKAKYPPPEAAGLLGSG